MRNAPYHAWHQQTPKSGRSSATGGAWQTWHGSVSALKIAKAAAQHHGMPKKVANQAASLELAASCGRDLPSRKSAWRVAAARALCGGIVARRVRGTSGWLISCGGGCAHQRAYRMSTPPACSYWLVRLPSLALAFSIMLSSLYRVPRRSACTRSVYDAAIQTSGIFCV